MIIPVLTFVIFFSGFCSAYWLFVLRPEQQTVGAVRRRLKAGHQAKAAQSKLLKQMKALSAVGPLNAALNRAQSRTKGLQTRIDQSGVQITVGALLAGS